MLHYTICRAKWPDPPDALLLLRKEGTAKLTAIEHTSYFNDTEAGRPSPLTLISDFWEDVQTSLCRRISHRRHLADVVSAYVQLNEKHLVGDCKMLARQFAAELVDFLESRPFKDEEQLPPYFSLPPITTFDGFPTLKSTIFRMSINRIKGRYFRARCSWMCSNITTGCIGLNLNYIKTAIDKKNRKAAKYNWMSADEKWLLIVAAGDILSNNAGPPEQQVDWNDSDLQELCRTSPFDRIVFWEYVRDWHKMLKPNGPTARCKKGM